MENNKNNLKEITKLFFEFGHLRRVAHTGWSLAGVEKPDSVAEHSLRAAQIGYVLADLENADANKTAMMCLFHDLGETRTGDHHRVATNYLDYFIAKDAEDAAFKEQTAILPEKSKNELNKLMDDFNERKTLEAICAKDADYLEQVITAKEYLDIGYKGCQDWINNIKKAVKTDTAKKFIEEIEKTERNDWWWNLKKLVYNLKREEKTQ